jgi:hypothetical protein
MWPAGYLVHCHRNSRYLAGRVLFSRSDCAGFGSGGGFSAPGFCFSEMSFVTEITVPQLWVQFQHRNSFEISTATICVTLAVPPLVSRESAPDKSGNKQGRSISHRIRTLGDWRIVPFDGMHTVNGAG